MAGAKAHTRLPIPNTPMLSRYANRGPNRVSSASTVVAAATDATRYTVVTHA